MSFLPFVRVWLWISVLASVAGWVLSAVDQLNRTGYLVFGILVAAGIMLRRRVFPAASEPADSGTADSKSRFKRGFPAFHWPKVRWRFRHALPAAFAILAVLAFLGGALYAPTNHASITYRTPRVLHWLAHGQWFWIHSANYRMNDRACGIEWLTAPLLLFTRSDRALFLFNFVPFLLLPGLIFSMFQRLGVNRRVAWQWMWLLPTGYSFLLQAASSANDTFPTVYALAAVDFAARAWRTRRFSDVGYSLLAAALLTGAKASNMPLLLGWGILLAGLLVVRREIVLHRSWAAIAAVLLAGLVSFLPTAALNVKYCHDWSGLSLERSGMDMKSPLVGIWGNSLIFLLDNFIPPFFPQAGWWNRSALTMLPQAIVRPMVANFEEGFHQLWEMPTEDWVGLGFGPSVLILLSILAGFRARRAGIASCLSPWAAEIPTGLRRCALLAPWLALLVYCMKSGMVTGARLISPYYPLLLPTLLLGAGQGEVVRRAWWKVCTWGALLIAAAVVVLNPARPLWPAKTVLAKISARRPESKLIARAYNAYSIYSVRADPLAAVRALLPQDLAVVGFMAAPDDPDISLWRPFGKRRVEHFLITDTAAAIQARHIDYAVVGGLNLSLNSTPLEAWLTRARAELVAKTSVTVKLAEGPQDWYVVRFRP